jgi:multiple sugar transport system substrate-binding protein
MRRPAPAAASALRRRLPGLAWLPIAAVALLAPVGCGRLATGPAPKQVIYWTGWSAEEFNTQQRLVDEFNREHPGIQVQMLSQFGNSGYQKVRIAFAGGATPDVMSTIWADELAGYAMRGVLEPLDGYLKRSGRNLERDFTPGVARMLRVRGKVYGLCATTNTSFIAYNKSIFREAGLDPYHPPTTIAELDAAARACTVYDRRGSFVRYGFRPGGLALWAYVFGGQWVDPATGHITADHPGNLAALRWLASYAKRYDLKKMQVFQSTFGSDQTANGPFFVGKVAMWSTGEWAEQFVRRYAPDLEWGWFPLPAPPGGRTACSSAGGSVFVIPAACKDKEAAWTFLDWFTRPKPVARFCSGIGNVPPVVEAGADPVFQQSALFRFAVNLSRSSNTFGPPGTPIWPTYAREIGRVEEKVMLGGGDPVALLADLQRRMTREQLDAMQDLSG